MADNDGTVSFTAAGVAASIRSTLSGPVAAHPELIKDLVLAYLPFPTVMGYTCQLTDSLAAEPGAWMCSAFSIRVPTLVPREMIVQALALVWPDLHPIPFGARASLYCELCERFRPHHPQCPNDSGPNALAHYCRGLADGLEHRGPVPEGDPGTYYALGYFIGWFRRASRTAVRQVGTAAQPAR